MHFLGSRQDFLALKMIIKTIIVDLIVNFVWLYRMSQSEFSIKNYVCLKLKQLDFNFYLFFSLSVLIPLLYMKQMTKKMVIYVILLLNFYFWIVGLE
jgi:pilus assembly protein TadC